MKLYHGTYLDELVKIIKDGKLDNTKVNESTSEFDAIFEEITGENFTKNALYFSDDIECVVSGYDFEFVVDTEGSFIDTKYLFVADFEKREEIMCATTDEEKRMRVQEYKDSFIPYDEYEKCWVSYDKKHTLREFLYFNTVDISLDIEENKEEILEVFEDNWSYPQDYKVLLGDFCCK